MKKYEVLDKLVKEGNGYLQTATVLKNNISKQTLAKYVKSKGMKRLVHGVYTTDVVWPDDYYLLFLRNKQIVFSVESSLYLHGLMDKEPQKTTVTVPEGYNASHIVSKGVKVIHTKKEWYEIGIITISTSFGNQVHVYDKERTICDIIRNKENIEIQTFQTAMREYMGGKEKNLGNLIKYAKTFGIEKQIRTYTEIML